MPTFNNTATTATRFFFNHVITWFGVPKQLVFDHGRHFEDETWHELASLLGFKDQYSLSYYQQGNGQVESVNKIFSDTHKKVVACHKCHIFEGRRKLLPFPLKTIQVEAPFQQWGLDFRRNQPSFLGVAQLDPHCH